MPDEWCKLSRKRRAYMAPSHPTTAAFVDKSRKQWVARKAEPFHMRHTVTRNASPPHGYVTRSTLWVMENSQ
jgi:hypothetical protein